MSDNEELKPKVTWEDYCRVTQLSIELMRDNAQLREMRKADNWTICTLIKQQDDLWTKLKELGYEAKVA